jgi:hypothetical protein
VCHDENVLVGQIRFHSERGTLDRRVYNVHNKRIHYQGSWGCELDCERAGKRPSHLLTGYREWRRVGPGTDGEEKLAVGRITPTGFLPHITGFQRGITWFQRDGPGENS